MAPTRRAMATTRWTRCSKNSAARRRKKTALALRGPERGTSGLACSLAQVSGKDVGERLGAPLAVLLMLDVLDPEALDASRAQAGNGPGRDVRVRPGARGAFHVH